MSDSMSEESKAPEPTATESSPEQKPEPPAASSRGWWLKLFLQPFLFLSAGALLFAGLGLAQRMGWISAGHGDEGHVHEHATGGDVQYICPMMCTPPQSEPGRCPVCGMELVPTSSAGGNQDPLAIHVDPAARRVAHIHTVAVKSIPLTRTIRSVGELGYDEGSLKTLAAYVDGRLDALYADYTGVVVNKGDHLALVYSPELYTGQVELLLAKRANSRDRSEAAARLFESDGGLYDVARDRLIELGMTPDQIDELEEAGQAKSRMYLCAPISGTVIEKLAVEGQYVKEGQPIYKLADLSTVWLMLKLFPEDAATIHYGQQVQAEVQSLPGRTFQGRVAFIDPEVDPKTRTVDVRVVIANERGLLRVGDYAKATIEVPVGDGVDAHGKVYDPQLADKWISPRHPHVIESSPGQCRVCGIELVPAAQFGFTDNAAAANEALVVPRSAVLMAGKNSVVYVETEPGRFEIRRVVLGPTMGDQIALRSGVKAGEQVATQGNFLIDSQMQLAGNPSLIDPTKAKPRAEEPASEEILAALQKLSPEDRQLAEQQQFCPVTDLRLGSMGPPETMEVKGTRLLICCEGCRASLLEDPQKYLDKLANRKHSSDAGENGPQMDRPPIGVPQMMEGPDVPETTPDGGAEIGPVPTPPIGPITELPGGVLR